MKRLRLFPAFAIIAIVVLAYNSDAVFGFRQNSKGAASGETKKQTFIVIYKPGSAWLSGKSLSEQPLKEHFQYILNLYKTGVLRFAGPFEDNSGGAAVIEATGESEAKDIANHDPAVINHVFVYDLHPWRLVSWDQYLKK
ncbi:MAG TPA: YciI family protein [Blastocatellia bacterium]|nr:YciI family protein [Blastocatellia bacterium]